MDCKISCIKSVYCRNFHSICLKWGCWNSGSCQGDAVIWLPNIAFTPHRTTSHSLPWHETILPWWYCSSGAEQNLLLLLLADSSRSHMISREVVTQRSWCKSENGRRRIREKIIHQSSPSFNNFSMFRLQMIILPLLSYFLRFFFLPLLLEPCVLYSFFLTFCRFQQ